MLIIVCFRGLKKSRILIVILDFLSPLKRTIIRAFSVISFYKWYKGLVVVLLVEGLNCFEGEFVVLGALVGNFDGA